MWLPNWKPELIAFALFLLTNAIVLLLFAWYRAERGIFCGTKKCEEENINCDYISAEPFTGPHKSFAKSLYSSVMLQTTVGGSSAIPMSDWARGTDSVQSATTLPLILGAFVLVSLLS